MHGGWLGLRTILLEHGFNETGIVINPFVLVFSITHGPSEALLREMSELASHSFCAWPSGRMNAGRINRDCGFHIF
jgi:hypothetical protein